MDYVNAALLWNTKGVNYMTIGDYENGIESFRSALDTILFVDKSVLDGLQAAAAATTSTTTTERSDYWDFGSVPALARKKAENGCVVFEECFSIFPKPGLMEAGSEDDDGYCLCRSDIDLLTATFLYNMALAYHLIGLCEQELREASFAMALRTHSVAMCILLQLHATDDSLALLLATSNNTASLCLDVYDYAAFDECRKRMAWILADHQRCYPPFFAGNYAVTFAVRSRPAPAA